MFLKATAAQTAFLLRRKGAICTFYILLCVVGYNFIRNVLVFQGRDISQMYHPMKLLTLSYNHVNFNADIIMLLVQMYPLLVAVPAGFSLAKEYQTGERLYMTARLGRGSYIFSRLLAVFLTTFLVFTVPFLLEILLNCLSFPLEAACDLSNWSYYSSEYIDSVHHYLMEGLYLYSPYLYAVVGTLFFGVVSGILGIFTMAVSSVIGVKYQGFLFLPVFLLLNATVFFSQELPREAPSQRWYDYILLFNDEVKDAGYLFAGLLLVLCFTFGAVFISSRKDCV